MQEALLLNIEHDMGKLNKPKLTFRDLGRLYFDLKYIFTTGSKLTEKQAASLEARLKSKPELSDYDIKKNENVYHVLRVKGPREIREKLPKNFLTPHYTEQVYNRISEPGTFVEIPDDVHEALLKRKEFNERMEKLKQRIAEEFPEKKKSGITLTFNRFNELFFSNPNITDEEIRSKKMFSEISSEIISERRSLCDLQNQISSFGKTEYIKEKRSLELIVDDSTEIKRKRQLTHQEIMNEKWVFLDIERPHYKKEGITRLPHQKDEISWIGMTFYEKGSFRKELHTLSETKLDELNGFKIIKHENERDLLNTVKARIKEENPYFASSYNTTYDFLNIRDQQKEYDDEFDIGEDNAKPRIEVHPRVLKKKDDSKKKEKDKEEKKKISHFMERIGLKGKQLIDMFSWAKLIFSGLDSYSLETVANKVLKRYFEKGISYEEMAKLEEDARYAVENPNLTLEQRIEAARKIAKYSIEDVNAMTDVFFTEEFQKTLALAAEIGNHYRIPLTRLLYAANAINDAQKRRYAEVIGFPRDVIFRMDNEKMILERQDGLIYFKNMMKKKGVEQYGERLHDFIMRNYPEADYLDEISRRDLCKAERTFLNKLINAQSNYLAVEYGIYKMNEEKFLEVIDKERKQMENLIDLRTGLATTKQMEDDIEKEIMKTRSERRELREKLSKQRGKIYGNFAVNTWDIDKALQVSSPWYSLKKDQYEWAEKYLKEAGLNKKRDEHELYAVRERVAIMLENSDDIDFKDLSRRYRII